LAYNLKNKHTSKLNFQKLMHVSQWETQGERQQIVPHMQ
jgi:hypothetical protein